MQVFTGNDGNGAWIDRVLDVERAHQLCAVLADSGKPMVRLAGSGEQQDPVQVLVTALSQMDLNVNVNLGELLAKLRAATAPGMTKAAEEKDGGSRVEHLKIASREIKDSHYQIDVAQDSIRKNGQRLQMVSLYLMDAYLGKYLIKRNFFFLDENLAEANDLFSDMVKRATRIKQRYLEEKIPVNAIFTETRAYLDGCRGDIQEKPVQ